MIGKLGKITRTISYASTLVPWQDVVAVYDGLTQVFKAARPMTASVREESKFMEHPGESGITITDHMVVQPVEVELLMTLSPGTLKDTYKEIKNLFLSGKLLTVQTKTDRYANMAIMALPHDETPDFFDTALLTLKLKEVRFAEAEFKAQYKSKTTGQSDTQKRGEVQPQERKGSWAYKHLPIGKK